MALGLSSPGCASQKRVTSARVTVFDAVVGSGMIAGSVAKGVRGNGIVQKEAKVVFRKRICGSGAEAMGRCRREDLFEPGGWMKYGYSCAKYCALIGIKSRDWKEECRC